MTHCTICTGPNDLERELAGIPYCSKTCRGVYRRLEAASPGPDGTRSVDDLSRYVAAVQAREAIREDRQRAGVQS